MSGEFKGFEQTTTQETSPSERDLWDRSRDALFKLIRKSHVKKGAYPLALIAALQSACAGELASKDSAKHPFPQKPDIVQRQDGTFCLDIHRPACRGVDFGSKTKEVCTCLDNLSPDEQQAIERLQLASGSLGNQESSTFVGNSPSLRIEEVGEMSKDVAVGFESLGLSSQSVERLLNTLPGNSIESVVFSESCPSKETILEPGQVIIAKLDNLPHNREQLTFYSPNCQTNPELALQTLQSSLSRQVVMAYVKANNYFGFIGQHPDTSNVLDAELREVIKPTANPNLPTGPNLPSAYGGPLVPADEYAEVYQNVGKHCTDHPPDTKYELRRKQFLAELFNAALHTHLQSPKQNWQAAFKRQLMGQYQTAEPKADQIVQFMVHLFAHIDPKTNPNQVINDFQQQEHTLNSELSRIKYKQIVMSRLKDQGLQSLFSRAVGEPSQAIHPLMLLGKLEKRALRVVYAEELSRQKAAEERLEERIDDQHDESLNHLLLRLDQLCKDLLIMRRNSELGIQRPQAAAAFDRDLQLFATAWSSHSAEDKQKFKPFVIHYLRIKYYGDGMVLDN